MSEEKCIIPTGNAYINRHFYTWFNFRISGTVRHEIFFGSANRKKSIQYGLVVFIKPEDHNISRYGVHCIDGHEFDMYLKRYGQKIAMEHYGWSVDDFRKIFGKNYL